MKPEEKAKELIERFRRHAKIGADTIISTRTENAKACALICVEEILHEWHNYYEAPISEKRFDYWQQVKQSLQSGG